ncbi:MAG: hypothetical protein MHMPM18_001208 [Marteilia pararefringens]
MENFTLNELDEDCFVTKLFSGEASFERFLGNPERDLNEEFNLNSLHKKMKISYNEMKNVIETLDSGIDICNETLRNFSK